jgi:hypothetical protein
MWLDFFQEAGLDKYSIYIHYKNYKPSVAFDKYKLQNCIPTSYGDISLVKAQKLLLSEALKDEPYDILYPLIINWYNDFNKFDNSSEIDASLYAVMQNWINENVG